MIHTYFLLNREQFARSGFQRVCFKNLRARTIEGYYIAEELTFDLYLKLIRDNWCHLQTSYVC